MEAGLLIRWGQVIPGREEQSLELFTDAVTYYESMKADGKLTSYEPFIFSTADLEAELGFFLIKGPITGIFEMMESEAYKTLVTKANMLLHHVTISLLTVGDQVTAQLERFDKSRAELNV